MNADAEFNVIHRLVTKCTLNALNEVYRSLLFLKTVPIGGHRRPSAVPFIFALGLTPQSPDPLLNGKLTARAHRCTRTAHRMTPVNQSRKAALLKAMNLIRPVFRSHGYDIEPYSNNAIADALLATCPQMDESWLSSKHLRMTVRHLQRRTSIRTVFVPWLRRLVSRGLMKPSA